MDELNTVELAGVVSEAVPDTRTAKAGVDGIPEETFRIATGTGVILVTAQGDRTKFPIVFCGDLGLTRQTSFYGFLSNPDVARLIFPRFCCYHVELLGQEENAEEVSGAFPSWEDFVGQLEHAREELKINGFLAFGVGSGGNLLVKYLAQYPKRVFAFIGVSCTHKAPGMIESTYKWAGQTMMSWLGMGDFLTDQYLQRYFSPVTIERRPDLCDSYRAHLQRVSGKNLNSIVQAYMSRTAVADEDLMSTDTRVLLFSGEDSYYVGDCRDLLHAFDPSQAKWLRVNHCGSLCHEEQPEELVESLRCFFTGLGLMQYNDY